jgi:hypothetical protein
MVVHATTRRFTVEEYDRLGEAGILGEDDRVELIEGEIIEMVPIGSPHSGQVNRLTSLFSQELVGRAVVGVQNPVRLDRYSEPQPDLALLRPRADFYAEAHPGPSDVLLLVEVADHSAAYDRAIKAPLYAHSGIPELWLVVLPERVVEVYREPSPDGYRDVRPFRAGEVLSPLAFPEVTVDVGNLFPPAERV